VPSKNKTEAHKKIHCEKNNIHGHAKDHTKEKQTRCFGKLVLQAMSLEKRA